MLGLRNQSWDWLQSVRCTISDLDRSVQCSCRDLWCQPRLWSTPLGLLYGSGELTSTAWSRLLSCSPSLPLNRREVTRLRHELVAHRLKPKLKLRLWIFPLLSLDCCTCTVVGYWLATHRRNYSSFHRKKPSRSSSCIRMIAEVCSMLRSTETRFLSFESLRVVTQDLLLDWRSSRSGLSPLPWQPRVHLAYMRNHIVSVQTYLLTYFVCPTCFGAARQRYLGVDTLWELLENVKSRNIVAFIKDTIFYCCV